MRLPFVLILLLVTLNTKAQNLVPNGSFEQYTMCPTGISMVTNYCAGWREYTATTPDYFHICGFAPQQQPAHGVAIMGVWTNGGSPSPNIYKEYIAANISPLVPGNTYEVSMSVSLSNDSRLGWSDLGAFFYDVGPATSPTNNLTTLVPQISYSNYGPIMDTAGWVRLAKTFIADSAYDNIVIGGFKGWNAIGPNDTMRLKPNGYESYYYIDSVVVRFIDSLSFSISDTLLCVGDSIIAPFNTNVSIYSSTNVFTLQLSDATGSFANPITIASITGTSSGILKGIVPASVSGGSGYKMRIVSSSPAKTVINDKTIGIGLSAPVKPVATANSLVCGGDTLFLNASTSTTGVTWQWSGPNFSANTQSPTVLNFGINKTGDYVVTACNFGCESKDTITIAYQAPIITLNASNSGPVCAGTGFNLSTTASSSGVSYSWTGPNSFTSSLQNLSFSSSTLNMSGDYIVTATLNACSTSDTTTVLIKPVPVATASNNSPVCEDGTLNLTASSTVNGSSFAWSGPLSFTSTLQYPTISSPIPSNSGNYTLIATKDGCSSQPVVTNAIIHPTPTTPVANANSIMCDGSPLNLSTGFVSNAIYSWTGPNGFTSSLQNPTINPATFVHAGYYSLRTSVNGCISEKDSVNVTVNIIPKIGGWASPDDTICEGTLTTYVAVHSNGGINPVFQWYKNYAPIPGATGLVYNTSNLKTGDILYCTMYSVGVCTDPVTVSTDTIYMVVLPIVTQPSATISSVPAIPQPEKLATFTAHVKNGGPNPKYQWQLNGVDQIGATSATWSAYTLKPFDKVNVIIVSDDPCAINKTASSDTITLGFATSISTTDNNALLKVFPNPNDGNFRITASNITEPIVKLEVTNAIGQLVYIDVIETANNQVNADITLDGFAGGIYLLKLNTGATTKLVRLTIR